MKSDPLFRESLIRIMQSELLLTIGCTDPAAIAFASAAAVHPGEDRKISRVELFLDRNILKNAQSVIIPGTSKSGIDLAAAIGIVRRNHEAGVLVFNDMNDRIEADAEALLKNIDVKVLCNNRVDHIFIEVKILYADGGSSAALIENHHHELQFIKDNDLVIYQIKDAPLSEDTGRVSLKIPEIDEITETVSSYRDEELSFLGQAIETNLLVATSGLDLSVGSGVGRWLEQLYNPDSGNWASVIMKSRVRVAAATDSRMGGLNIPVMACGGSGNHGLTYFITLNEIRDLKKDKEGPGFLQSTALGLILLHYIKEATGILTPMCGCAMAAGMAASAAITWYMNGDEKAVIRSMNYVLGFLGGIVCDGAKRECSLKTSLSAQTAIESSLLAKEKNIDYSAGFFTDSLSGILENLYTLHKKGMKGFDEVMVDILLKKNDR